jgi:hypothetical protein
MDAPFPRLRRTSNGATRRAEPESERRVQVEIVCPASPRKADAQRARAAEPPIGGIAVARVADR